MEIGNGETRCHEPNTGLQANDGLTGFMNRAMGTPNHLWLRQGIATPLEILPLPDSSRLLPGLEHHLQQLHVPWFPDLDQWRMIEAHDGKFLNRGSRI